MAPDDFDRQAVPALVGRLLGYSVHGVQRIDGGFGGDTWRVDAPREGLVVKVAPSNADLGKLRAATDAHRAAEAAGLPVPHLLAVDEDPPEFRGRVARCYRWLDGRHPAVGSPDLADDLGRVLGRLHAVTMPTFSSRWGQPGPPTWAAYVRWRIPQIHERALRSGAFASAPLDDLFAATQAVADRVSPVVHPALTHRDLNSRNLLVDESGRLVGLLDFDGAEAWDPVVDLLKLRDSLLDEDLENRLLAAYPRPLDRLAERRVVVAILQYVNGIANARLDGGGAYERMLRDRLDQVVTGLPSLVDR